MTFLDKAILTAMGIGIAFILIEIYLIGERRSNRQQFSEESEWFI